MQIGDRARWWNRSVPIGRIGLIVLFILTVVWIAPYFYDGFDNLTWGISHKWTATYHGESLKLPAMWRQEETPNGQKMIALQRARWGQSFAFERILISDATASPVDLDQTMQRLRNMESVIGSVNTDVFVPKNRDVAAHYACIASSQPRYGRLRIDCVANNGKWIATLDGSGRNIPDFLTILNNLSRMGDPLPL
jgi:hypothetical protein